VETKKIFLRQDAEFGRCLLLAAAACESAYLTNALPLRMKHNHPELPSLMLLCQLISKTEGVLYKEIRGSGLAYDAAVVYYEDWGLLKLDIYRSANVILVFEKCKSLIENLLSDENSISEHELESAKSSLVFELIQCESTVSNASMQSLLSYYRGVELDHYKQLIVEIWRLNAKDLFAVGRKYVLPLFDWNRVNTAIVSHPSKTKEIIDGFAAMNCVVEEISMNDPRLVNFSNYS